MLPEMDFSFGRRDGLQLNEHVKVFGVANSLDCRQLQLVAILSRCLRQTLNRRFADLPQIERATGYCNKCGTALPALLGRSCWLGDR